VRPMTADRGRQWGASEGLPALGHLACSVSALVRAVGVVGGVEGVDVGLQGSQRVGGGLAVQPQLQRSVAAFVFQHVWGAGRWR